MCGECECDENIFSGPFCEICTGSRAVSCVYILITCYIAIELWLCRLADYNNVSV